MAVFVSGPHTNLVEAQRLDSGIKEHIGEVYIMGGSVYSPGNI
jgi:inosine-uridine nucleoside N-ribohydrolase